MNFMDYCFLTVLLLCGFAGMYQGLVRSVIGIASVILTFFISISYYPHLAATITAKTPIDDMLRKAITSNLNTTLNSMPGSDVLVKLNDSFVNMITSNIHVPQVLKGVVNDKIISSIQGFSTQKIIDLLSNNWTGIFINIMSFIIIFATLQFIFVIIQNFLGALVTLPILSEVNLIGGFVLGIIQGFVVVYLICLGWSMLSGVPMYREVFVDLQASKYAKGFYDHNLLLDILVKFKILK